MALTLVTEASLMFLWRCSYIWIERSDTPDSYARSCWVFLRFFLANASLVCLGAFFAISQIRSLWLKNTASLLDRP